MALDLSSHRTPCFCAGPHLISRTPKPPGPRVSREGVACVTCQESGRPSRILLDISSERLGLAANAKHTPCSSRCCCPRTAIARQTRARLTLSPTPPRPTREQRGVEPAPWFGPTLRRAMRRAPADERWCDCFFPPFFLFSPLVWCLSKAWGPTNLSLFRPEPSCTGF